MSRSYRKTPITGISLAESEKQDKRLANRAFRRKSKVAIIHGDEPPFSIRSVSEVYCFAKDGKQYCRAEIVAKDPELMRK